MNTFQTVAKSLLFLLYIALPLTGSAEQSVNQAAQNCIAKFETPYFTWSKLPVPIYVDFALPASFQQSVIDETKRWNETLKMEAFAFKGVSKGCAEKSINCVILEDHAKFLGVSGKEDYAFTKQEFTDSHWDGADIFLNSEMRWKHPAAIGDVDYSNVIRHELGHVLGLRHHFFHLSSIMNYLPYEAGVSHLDISDFDIEIIRWLYSGGPCPADYYLAFIDGQDGLALQLFKKAKPDFNKITDLNQIYLLSRLQRSAGKLGDSLDSINKAIEIGKSSPAIVRAYLLNHKADLLFRMRDNGRALKVFEDSLSLAPGNYQTMTYIALLGHLRGQKREISLKLLEKALAIKPTFDMAIQLKDGLISERHPK